MASSQSEDSKNTHVTEDQENVYDDRASTIRPLSLHFSDHGEDDHASLQGGTYSARMEELMAADEYDGVDEDDSDSEGFVYTGVDSQPGAGTYNEQLRDVLGPDSEGEDDVGDEMEFHFGGRTMQMNSAPDLVQHSEVVSDATPSNSSIDMTLPMTPPRLSSPAPHGSIESSLKVHRPFLNPTISRLRSYTPQSSRLPSFTSQDSRQSKVSDGFSPSPSHFPTMSAASSVTNLNVTSSERHEPVNGLEKPTREVFRWNRMKTISDYVYAKKSQKAAAVLGSITVGTPTVLAVSGSICVGTDSGRTFVFDFKQNLRCICGDEATGKAYGPVTALALSHDHTFVAVGHMSGHIQLFDLNNGQSPVRLVTPTSRAAVASGTKEGHLAGSRIVSIGFVALRHTAIVSADEHGLAFYHSLGKVLFVEASDTLRILGKYPEDDHSKAAPDGAMPRNGVPSFNQTFRRRVKSRTTILSMMPLPLGVSPHPVDAYHVTALLTPAKLVIVGLKPNPRTWFRRLRDEDEPAGPKSFAKWRGTLAWLPSSAKDDRIKDARGSRNATLSHVERDQLVDPILAYSWGKDVYLLRVLEKKAQQTVKNSRTGKVNEVEVGSLAFDDIGHWRAPHDVLALQWLSDHQVIYMTSASLEVYDIHTQQVVEQVPFDAKSMMSPTLNRTTNGTTSYTDSIEEIAHSMGVYKGKVFLLSRESLDAGTLITWADRVLSFVEAGDFLNAIDLTRSYYTGEAPGNKNGLPTETVARKTLVGQKMHDLMVASARYAFSEDRMKDGTHVTPDGRGVDRTALFEGLVSTCARACIALDVNDFLFEDLYQYYEDHGIASIYLRQLEPFVLDGNIRAVPPRISQRLIALHEGDARPDLAERIIWHIDPSCLDTNQAIRLCQTHHLYDALIYVYTRCLQDYVSPMGELFEFIRRVQRYRKTGAENAIRADGVDDPTMMQITLIAYKIFAYLANILSGLTYPSEEPLPDDDDFHAKTDVYNFLFDGRSCVWPPGDGGKLVVTADDEGGPEPTYPYARLLLTFDAESFLHTLDIAFEDGYLNDKSQLTKRLIIVKILLEIASSGNLSSSDLTFVNIFIARSVAKYYQVIQLTPSAQQNLLIGLAQDPDPNTREDRQLAAEYLLSVYTPHDSRYIQELFEHAGFFRILRTWYRQEHQWPLLVSTYLNDPALPSADIISYLDDVLEDITRNNRGTLPGGVLETISNAIPELLQKDIKRAATLLDKYKPAFHENALACLGENGDPQRLIYLSSLLRPPETREGDIDSSSRSGPSKNVNHDQRLLYISLQCRYHPDEVIEALMYLPSDFVNWETVAETCQEHEVYEAMVWTISSIGRPQEALSRATTLAEELTTRLMENFIAQTTANDPSAIDSTLGKLESMHHQCVTVCLEQSQSLADDVSPENLWFDLLHSQIQSIHSVSSIYPTQASSDDSPGVELRRQALARLRGLVQYTFTAFVSISSAHSISFPRLFKRLVDPTSRRGEPSKSTYTEFRAILAGMLESYRSDGDMLMITKNLVDRDLFDVVEEYTLEKAHGWSVQRGICAICRRPLLEVHKADTPEAQEVVQNGSIVATRTGAVYHTRCSPSDHS